MDKGFVVSVNFSDTKGVPKKPLLEGQLKVGVGLVADAHAGGGSRQLSLLALESIEKMRIENFDVTPGSFAENITTKNINLYKLSVGTKLMLGVVKIEISQIGKKCHVGCAIRKMSGDCVMPKEGVFARVLSSGMVRSGDLIALINY